MVDGWHDMARQAPTEWTVVDGMVSLQAADIPDEAEVQARRLAARERIHITHARSLVESLDKATFDRLMAEGEAMRRAFDAKYGRRF